MSKIVICNDYLKTLGGILSVTLHGRQVIFSERFTKSMVKQTADLLVKIRVDSSVVYYGDTLVFTKGIPDLMRLPKGVQLMK